MMNSGAPDLCPYCFKKLPPGGKCGCAYESGANSRIKEALQPGMLVTDEPGVYLSGWGGLRIEDTVLVTETGCEPLTKAPKELIELGVR